MYGVIMAGGKGTRFWPLSREKLPKQYLRIAGKESLIQMAIKRLESLIPLQNIIIVSSKSQEKVMKEHLPHIPEENFIFEPVGKNTAPAIALSAFYLRERDPDAVMAVFPADHIIKNKREFLSTLRFAEKTAKKGDNLITLGIKPDSPETGFGYIHYGERFFSSGKKGVYRVKRFTEKPDLKTARRFLKTGSYLWNAGIFVWGVGTILKMFETHLPSIHQAFYPLLNAKTSRGRKRVITKAYSQVKEISVDYGIMEKAKKVLVIPCDIGWNDVGSWSSLKEVLPHDRSKNIIIGKHVGLNTKDMIIYSPDKLVTTIGLDNLIVVETPDTLLICPKDRAQDVKKLTELLSKKGKKRYL
jgi:mannose-1-phosphate guanylyltransferase